MADMANFNISNNYNRWQHQKVDDVNALYKRRIFVSRLLSSPFLDAFERAPSAILPARPLARKLAALPSLALCQMPQALLASLGRRSCQTAKSAAKIEGGENALLALSARIFSPIRSANYNFSNNI